jgi:hypothetical protein
MSKTGKVLLGIGGGILVVIAVVAIGGYFAMGYIEARLEQGYKADEDAGLDYGKKADQEGCISEGVKRSRSVSVVDVGKSVGLTTFVDACLKNAKPVDGFCKGVPAFWDVNDTKWLVDECAKAGADSNKTVCMGVFQAKHDFCSPPAK